MSRSCDVRCTKAGVRGTKAGVRGTKAGGLWVLGLSYSVVLQVLLGAVLAGPGASAVDAVPVERTVESPVEGTKQVYFGDLHIHTQLSMDAFLFGTRTTPDQAYRFAKGEPVTHASGVVMQLEVPLDFYAVTDHAEYLGLLAAINTPGHPLHSLPAAQPLLDAPKTVERGKTAPASQQFAADHANQKDLLAAWQQVIDAAEAHNEPGRLTTFTGFEYTSFRAMGNLHRNVIFQGSKVSDKPYGRLDSANPEDLWRWMDGLRSRGIESLSIPHNSNGSDGRMFETRRFDGTAMTRAYSAMRLRNEPLVEVTQVKGTSETHPFLSPNDELADFEIFPYRIATSLKSKPQGSYARDALKNGLLLADKGQGNPYKFGMIGSSDSHNGGATYKEENYLGKVGLLDASPMQRASIPSDVSSSDGAKGANPSYPGDFRMLYGAAGLTGVWAEENSRAAIYAALRRKETFATTGTRIKVRMFAGFRLPPTLHTNPKKTAILKKRAVAMGGELTRGRGPLMISAEAMQDAHAMPLQRLQVVKGWAQGGQSFEKVFDVACAGGAPVNPATHRCPDNKAEVDLTTCQGVGDGAASLASVWADPEFNDKQSAFYYVRAIENPSCRWSTWDALRAGVAQRAGLSSTLQERAYTSPVWYSPK